MKIDYIITHNKSYSTREEYIEGYGFTECESIRFVGANFEYVEILLKNRKESSTGTILFPVNQLKEIKMKEGNYLEMWNNG